MLFSVDDINELTNNIEVFHLNYIASTIGVEILSVTDRKRLTEAGINYKKYKSKTTAIEYAYYFGKAESSLRGTKKLEKLTFPQWQEFVSLNKERIKFNHLDAAAIREVRKQTYDDIKRLSKDMQTDFAEKLNEVSRTQKTTVERLLRKKVKGSDIATEAMGKISKHLAGNVKKWMNRIDLIVNYVMHEAYQYGIAIDLLDRHGQNVRVWYSLHSDACEHCVRVYLRKGAGSAPKVFYLKVVIANGNNIGRKPAQYKPSINPLHPRCRCKMNYYPKGKSKWNPKAKQYQRVFSK